MSAFDGSWKDEASAFWVIESEANNLTVYSPGGRGKFQGHELTAGNPVIYVNFSDIRPETGVLSNDKKNIYWGDGTRWVKES